PDVPEPIWRSGRNPRSRLHQQRHHDTACQRASVGWHHGCCHHRLPTGPGHCRYRCRRYGLRAIRLAGGDQVECDLLCVSGGFNPAVHLYSQAQGKLRYDERFACFRPHGRLPNVTVVGAANGEFDFAIQPCWLVPDTNGDWSTHFVDLERDVTVADMQHAVNAGMRSVEHVKRFTTIGTGSDQGKTSGINEVGLVGTLTGQPIGGVGTTTYRPPYVPVSFALMAGRNRGDLIDPIRLTSIHPWHLAHGAVFENVGQWKRPWYFPRHDEDMEAAVLRECRAARENVAVMD